MLSISSPSASLPFVRGATGLRLISLTVVQSLNIVFDASLNKLLNKPSYDITVMDDLALGGASLLSAHYVPVAQRQYPFGLKDQGVKNTGVNDPLKQRWVHPP